MNKNRIEGQVTVPRLGVDIGRVIIDGSGHARNPSASSTSRSGTSRP